MSLTSITQRTLTQEILKIDDKAEYLTKLKDHAIENLLLQKQSILEGKNADRSLDSLERNIKEIKSQHSTIMKEYVPRKINIHEYKTSIKRLENDVEEIERELKIIQQRHEAAMILLAEKKSFLQQRLNSIQNLDITISDLEKMIFEKTQLHASDIEVLLNQRKDLLERTDLNQDVVGELLEELDQEIEDKEHKNTADISELQNKLLNIKGSLSQNLEFFQQKRQEILDELQRLENMKLNASPSQLIEIERQIAVLQKELQDYNDLLNLLDISSSDKLLKLLEARGLRITASGRIQTMSGRILTLNEARDFGLLEGFGSDILLKLEELILSHEIYGEGSESTATSITSSTTLSGLTSNDVHYLKEHLGRPLALALAEITAKQPRDPIHYLAHWLMKFRYNQEIDRVKKQEMLELDNERKRIAALTLRQNAEKDAKAALLDLLCRVEEVVEKNRIMKELKRIEDESKYDESEEENLEMEARDTLGVYDGPTMGQKL